MGLFTWMFVGLAGAAGWSRWTREQSITYIAVAAVVWGGARGAMAVQAATDFGLSDGTASDYIRAIAVTVLWMALLLTGAYWAGRGLRTWRAGGAAT